MQKAIAYYRVSTARQGKSGLGLEAQQKSVSDFARANHLEVINDFIEVESAGNKIRHGLAAALKQCKEDGALLLIAKLDRLRAYPENRKVANGFGILWCRITESLCCLQPCAKVG